MEKRIMAGLILLTFFTLYTFPERTIGQEAPKPVPKMFLKEKVFDVGEVKEGDPIEHTFIVTNTGNAPLEIRNVKPG